MWRPYEVSYLPMAFAVPGLLISLLRIEGKISYVVPCDGRILCWYLESRNEIHGNVLHEKTSCVYRQLSGNGIWSRDSCDDLQLTGELDERSWTWCNWRAQIAWPLVRSIVLNFNMNGISRNQYIPTPAMKNIQFTPALTLYTRIRISASPITSARVNLIAWLDYSWTCRPPSREEFHSRRTSLF